MAEQIKRLPFDTNLQNTNKENFLAAFHALRKEAEDTPEMSLEEINAEIAKSRAERRKMKK